MICLTNNTTKDNEEPTTNYKNKTEQRVEGDEYDTSLILFMIK